MKQGDNQDRRQPANFRSLPNAQEASRMLHGLGERLVLEPGVDVITLGESSRSAFVLEEGALTVYTPTAFGDVVLAHIEPPSLIGEIAALAQTKRTASVKTASHSVLRRIDSEALLGAGMANPELFIQVIRQLGREIDVINNAIGLYTNSLQALEQSVFDPKLLEKLANPPPQLAQFSAVFERFAEEISFKKRQQEELASAAMIQQSFLPTMGSSLKLPPGLDLAARMRPARQVGGDFYDYFMLDDKRLFIAIGDICGKGMPASLFMAVAITTLRSIAQQAPDVAAIAKAANALLCRNNGSSQFSTAFLAIFDTATGQLSYCNCGHCPPVVIGAAGSPDLLAATGLPLGLYDHASATQREIMINDGDTLLLYSDGITEAANLGGEEFGENRLLNVLADNGASDAERLVERVIASADAFAGEAEQADDITCMALALSLPKQEGS